LTRSDPYRNQQNSDSTYGASLGVEIAVTRTLVGAVYVCDVNFAGVTWNVSQPHKLNVNSE